MANKIYDFLPAHLRNRDLEDIFDTTLERAFSKGNLEKTRAFVGRREKGLNNEDDSYLSFPEHLFQRDNYGLEPVFSNKNIKDRIFYEDLLNSMYNKGMLTNDHSRLFDSNHTTINLPIDADKFVNWQMYYWVKPQPLFYHVLDANGFGTYKDGEPILKPVVYGGEQVYVNHLGLNMTSQYKPEYITICDGAENYWSETNSWEHHDDIRHLMSNDPGATKIDIADYKLIHATADQIEHENLYVKNDNTHLFIQAQRPIIEFDNRLEIYNNVTEWEVPQFKLYDEDLNLIDGGFTIFEYVQDEFFTPDPVLGIDVKVVSGDYVGEFVFMITMPEGSSYKLNDTFETLYIPTEFNYRNLRNEYGRGTFSTLDLPMTPKTNNDVDVYINGVKQIGNYSIANDTVTFTNEIEGDVYVDLCTRDVVDLDGDVVWQRLNPNLEFNIDNEIHNLVEFTYSVFYEHFLRQIETANGLTGEANASNNYRTLGEMHNKTQFNKYGSVIVRHDTDIKKGYFSITRDDYDPFKSVEFLATAYSNYKNKLVLKVKELVEEDVYASKTNLEIFETAVAELALTKRESIDVFTGSDMIVNGVLYNHYTEGKLDIILGSFEHFVPSEMQNTIVNEKNLMVVVNDTIMKLGVDYEVSESGNQILFTNYMVQPSDDIFIRYYDRISETFIPPSAVSLGISELYVPRLFTDYEYSPEVTFLQGHDGSCTPIWGDRTDDIMMIFENLIYNRNTDKTTVQTNLDLSINLLHESDYTFAEKRFTVFPFFKKWMIRNNIDDLRNTQFDINDWKTWNYRALSDDIPGSYRSILEYVYGTEFIFTQPWLALGVTDKPKHTVFGWVPDQTIDSGYFEFTDFKSYDFWVAFKSYANATWPIPVDEDGNLKQITEIFNLQITDKQILKQDWEFGDGSPEELAWKRNSEYPFIKFLTKMLLKPFKILDIYDAELKSIINFYNKREGYTADYIVNERDNYEFKLGSKLGGFVNNFKLYSERNSFANTSKSEIPSDNYDLFIHSGEPNRSEGFSAIIIEKVSLDEQYPFYSNEDVGTYFKGDIVIRTQDNKHYKRKVDAPTELELSKADNPSYFDYAAWILVSQPAVKKFGYRVSGYDDFNPVFYTLDWDKTSGEKRWSSDGDLANIKQWTSGEFYRTDFYAEYNNKPYIALQEHQSSESFDNDLADGYWKLAREWPVVNTIDAVGYKEVLPDQIKLHTYGDILETVSDVAQLFVGYQEYLKVVGWDFTDLDEFSEVVDFETLLIQFLNWSRETHQVGDFITLTPILRTGRFDTPYGVATVGRTANKNFYRVVDSSGRNIDDANIKFNIDGNGIVWESNVPVYGIKIDIQDIEHAFTVDREDSYGDMIYEPLSHNRNLRMLVDCNRTADWDGTLSIDGYIAAGGKLVPNLETMVGETRYYRDTLVDQSLEIVNRLKESQMGFAPRTYLTNHFIDRETQLEFYKGFLSHKSTKDSVNRIINKRSNFADVKHDEMWAFRIDDYGKTKNETTISKRVSKDWINSDPYMLRWDENNQFKMVTDSNYRTVPIKTSGYVNPDDVNYIVRNNQILESVVSDTFYEGDTAWVRFDETREWDVKRLSEVAEIAYVGETADGQLYLGLTNEVSLSAPVFLKIDSYEIDPKINGYFNLVDDGIKEQNGSIIWEYLVFDTEYEPFMVEIDETTDNSVFVPTSEDAGVEAIGSVSNPEFIAGDELVINGVKYIYDGSSGTAYGITIGGIDAAPDPFITTGEEARIVVYDENGSPLNSNTVVRFDGTKLTCDIASTSNEGDVIFVNGVSITIANSSETTITATSDINEDSTLASGLEMTLTTGSSLESFVETADMQFVGTIDNPVLTATKALSVNGTTITFTVPDPITGADSIYPVNGETAPVSSVLLDTDMTNFLPGTVTVNDGVDTYVLGTSDYTYNSNTKTITFDTQIEGGLFDDDSDPLTPDVNKSTVSLIVELVAQPEPQSVDINYVIQTINSSGAPITASEANNKLVIDTGVSNITMSGSVLKDLGLSNTDTLTYSKLQNVKEQINAISYMTAIINSAGELVISTANEQLSVSGDLATALGFTGDFESTTAPNSSSIASQINAASIPSVTAESVGGILTIKFNGSELVVSEDTAGALERMGITSGLTTVTVRSIDTIIANINEVLPTGTIAYNFAGTDKVIITSSAKTVEITNYVGNPWDDLGIATGTYTNNSVSTNTSANAFRDQINNLATDVVVSISSDGRMIFTSQSVGIGFGGTPTAMLEKIGLYENYSSVKSNANFKIMRWKSVRYTPNHVHLTFDDFLESLGLNSYSKIWADEFRGSGWAVLGYSTTNSEPEILARQVHNLVDVDDIQRMIVKDGDTFTNYQLFDPLSYKLPGSITKDIDYVDWNDPAKYDDAYSNDLWLSEHEGEIWWDTDTVRYFRYKDYGDKNGNVNIDYVKRFWGKIVPGSTVKVKQWVSSSTVPSNVNWFNTETYWDTDLNKRVTKYYFWSTTGIETTDKEYSISEIRMLIAAGGFTNKFIPIDDRTVITTNNNILNNQWITFTVHKKNNKDVETKHVDWNLMSRRSSKPVDEVYLTQLRDSLVGNGVELVETISATDDQTVYTHSEFEELNITNSVVSVNNVFIDPIYVTFNGTSISITNTSIYEGDLVRFYKLSSYDGWFKNVNYARENFASITNDYLKNKMLVREIPYYAEHIDMDSGIFKAKNWAISEDFETIRRYEYLSKTRTFDMIKMFQSGVHSFKVDLPNEVEYYFEYLGNLRLVHKENAALELSYNDYTVGTQTELTTYYDNVQAVQTFEFINMIYVYGDRRFIKNMFFDMIDYMYTEKTYPDWIFKTSYIDLFMLNKPLRQYAIYQNDNYNDIIDYVNETKPYHSKIRETERTYPYSETATADVDIYEAMDITLFFGEHSRYKDIVYDAGDTTIIFERLLDIYTLEDSIPEELRELYHIYTYNKHLIQMVRNNPNHNLDDDQQDVINRWNTLQQKYLMDPNNEYNAGELLRRFNNLTAEAGGYDTGEFDAYIKDAMVMKIITHNSIQFFVYDVFGRGYYIPVNKISTLDSFDGESFTTSIDIRHAKDNTKQLVAFENQSGEVEFVMYDTMDNGSAIISNRAVFNGLAASFTVNDYLYILGTPRRIIDGDINMVVAESSAPTNEEQLSMVYNIRTNNTTV